MSDFSELEDLVDDFSELDDSSGPLESPTQDVAPPAKRQRTQPNRCSECGVPNKFTPKSGHTRQGWCPTKQRFTTRSSGQAKGAGERLRDLEQHPEQAELTLTLTLPLTLTLTLTLPLTQSRPSTSSPRCARVRWSKSAESW